MPTKNVVSFFGCSEEGASGVCERWLLRRTAKGAKCSHGFAWKRLSNYYPGIIVVLLLQYMHACFSTTLKFVCVFSYITVCMCNNVNEKTKLYAIVWPHTLLKQI